MLRRESLPDDLRARPFSVSEALGRGVSRKVLENSSLRRPHPGVRVPEHLPDDLVTRCAAASLALPEHAAFSHATAARLLRLPLPASRRDAPDPRVTAMVPAGRVVPKQPGIRVLEGLRPSSVLTIAGLRVVGFEATWCDLAHHLCETDAIALGDAVVTRRHGLATVLREVDRRSGRRGVVRLRELAQQLRWPVRSPMETVWRLDVARAGIPEPVLNAPIFDGAGGWLGAPDQQWPEVRVASEYDGDGHRTDPRQWREDIARRALMEDEGWWVQRVTAADVGQRSGPAIDRLWRALNHRGLPGLPPRP